MLGYYYTCIHKGDAEGFAAVHIPEGIAIYRRVTGEKITDVPITDIDTKNKPLYVGINQISADIFMICVLGAETSLIDPTKAYSEPQKLPDCTMCMVQIESINRFTFSVAGFSDKIYMCNEGKVTELLQFSAQFDNSVLVIDEIAKRDKTYRRRLIRTSDNKDLVPPEYWIVTETIRLPKVLVSHKTILLNTGREIYNNNTERNLRSKETREAILIGYNGDMKHKGEVEIEFLYTHVNMLYPEIWMGVNSLFLSWKHGGYTKDTNYTIG